MIALRNILVATDFSAAADAALLYGRDFARGSKSTLHVLHVVDSLASRVTTPTESMRGVNRLQADLEADAHRAIHALLSGQDRRGHQVRAVVLTSSRTAETIVEYAHEHQIDLIVIGTHGRTGVAHFFMGSVAQQVVRAASCPVLTVRHPEREFVRPDALQIAAAR